MADMPKTYDPAIFEPEILKRWLDADLYRRRPGKGDCTITIPPPNVTGRLHMGHATDDTIQDALVRMARMRGLSTRWVLGTDHAGIATQTKVDKQLKESGVNRLEIGRERFLKACWDWTHEYGGMIVEQIKRMGCSIDFANERFTMDDDYAAAVRKVFVSWYRDDLIYRGKRIVNWCPSCATAISDDEAEYETESGHLWHLRYPLTEPIDGTDYIVVATTRPETMLGDTGVAVSPKDPSKAAFVGATVRLPIVDREIPIFADYHVDACFGSGFVKVTPAHDPNDFAMGEAHGLEKINIFDEHAVVVEGYGPFSGMSREACRAAVLAWFDDHGLLDHIDEHEHSVMHCYRCGTALEPWLSEQWFVAVDRLKDPALDAVRTGKVRFYPERWTQTYTTWMENLKDWCISRQLWWGHRIPVFYCDACGWTDALEHDPDVCPVCGGAVHQDEDVLDTWFSSQLWTFATQGWPQNPEDLAGHHPTAALVTARDIIALWVARMVMSSLYFLDEVPFHDVVIYPTILAKDGSRMSKSKGNGVDPMDLIERYGADAMRFNLLTLCTTNQDVKFDADIDPKTHEFKGSPRTEQARSFVTKIWNASRFLLMNMEGYTPGAPVAETAADAWIFSRLAKATELVTLGLSEYVFGDMARGIQTFFWNEVCDWYIEVTKARLTDDASRLTAQRNLIFVLDTALRLMHPLMPFVTEAIWSSMPPSWLDVDPHTNEIQRAQALMVASWPEPDKFAQYKDEEAERSFELLRTVVSAIRSTRARYRLSPREKLSVVVRMDAKDVERFSTLGTFAESLACAELSFGSDLVKPAASIAVVEAGIEVFCVLAGKVDLQAERARIEREIAKVERDLASAKKTLENKGFLAKAAPDVVLKKRERAEELADQLEALKRQGADLTE
ncbi:valine--tRNA ligase [Collinsella sp. AGMB00827]|uniref:Valine--tRNA ligase n=1 Tax=Collinsella ureilytica TaxID=2869515 RepID=A0ABS7MKN6_9ACTN|nr:valine--tRNA ligase [Collinsella urealyticum]MBY4797929.1 valine--tRNA ligase [Collinsella urealyticum]